MFNYKILLSICKICRYHKTVGSKSVKRVIVRCFVVQRRPQNNIAVGRNRKYISIIAEPIFQPLVFRLVGDDCQQDAVQRHVFQHAGLIVVL